MGKIVIGIWCLFYQWDMGRVLFESSCYFFMTQGDLTELQRSFLKENPVYNDILKMGWSLKSGTGNREQTSMDKRSGTKLFR